MSLTRRGLVGGLAALTVGLTAGIAAPALADTKKKKKKPARKPAKKPAVKPAPVVLGTAEEIVAAAGLSGMVSYVLADRATGAILEQRDADRPMPPASTAKTLTTIYALAALGQDYRFTTDLLPLGPVSGGRVSGGLLLAGGGDPTLSTDDLGDMVAELAARGVKGTDGRFGVWGGALPYLPSIDPGQPCWMGYDPSVGGLNLNFNRVNLSWEPGGTAMAFDARGERFAPATGIAAISAEARESPLFTCDAGGGAERFTVAAPALGRAGSRWLPVRRPDLYAGDVFRTLAAAQGIGLPAPERMATPASATPLVRHQSAPLGTILRDMLKYSTNMTAEAVGMTASASVGVIGHDASAASMSQWVSRQIGGVGGHLVDHSGLGPASRVTAAGMARALGTLGPKVGLPGFLKEMRIEAAADRAAPQRVVAKTGTLDFVSGLVGYLTTATGQERVFAIYAADLPRHDAVTLAQAEAPPGLSAWLGRARRMQTQLLQVWG